MAIIRSIDPDRSNVESINQSWFVWVGSVATGRCSIHCQTNWFHIPVCVFLPLGVCVWADHSSIHKERKNVVVVVAVV